MICPRCSKVMHKENYAFYWCDCGMKRRVYDGGTSIFYDENENVYHPKMDRIEETINIIEKEIEDWKKGL